MNIIVACEPQFFGNGSLRHAHHLCLSGPNGVSSGALLVPAASSHRHYYKVEVEEANMALISPNANCIPIVLFFEPANPQSCSILDMW